jgi:hypothetical protein
MQTNWSTTTTQVNLEELVALQEKLRRKCEDEFLTKLPSVFTPIEPMEFKWLEPQMPKPDDYNAMKFRVFTDMSYKMSGVPRQVLFGCDVGNVDATFVAYEAEKPKNKWLRVAALAAAVILFVAIWSQR